MDTRTTNRCVIHVEPGRLKELAEAVECALIDAGLPIFVNGGSLVYPVRREINTPVGRTVVVRLVKIKLPMLRQYMDQACHFLKVVKDEWSDVDPPSNLACLILARDGYWQFPQISDEGEVQVEPSHRPANREP